MADKLIIIANPGSASRKYAIYRGSTCLARLHFEIENRRVVYRLHLGDQPVAEPQPAGISHVSFAPTKLAAILASAGVLNREDQPAAIGLRVVAPSSFFTTHRRLTPKTIELLKLLEPYAELHISATLQELSMLSISFPKTVMLGVSDSAFHANRPDYARSYGIPPADAKALDIWRFGYHGLSVESVVTQLRWAKLLPKRLLVCHIGGGVSVTALQNGRSLDTTMGYSPLEGPIMASRSGSIDPAAVQVIAKRLKLDDKALELYLNTKSGLKGLTGSEDIRELLRREADGDKRSALALEIYVYRLQQAIGQMAAALQGADGLAFTGTVGERSAAIRQRITKGLLYLGFSLDHQANQAVSDRPEITAIHQPRHPDPVLVVPTDEASSMLRAVQKHLG